MTHSDPTPDFDDNPDDNTPKSLSDLESSMLELNETFKSIELETVAKEAAVMDYLADKIDAMSILKRFAAMFTDDNSSPMCVNITSILNEMADDKTAGHSAHQKLEIFYMTRLTHFVQEIAKCDWGNDDHRTLHLVLDDDRLLSYDDKQAISDAAVQFNPVE